MLDIILPVILGIMVFNIVLKHPYLGIGFMLATMPFNIFTSIPGNLSKFTSLTSFLGLLTLVAYILKSKNIKEQNISHDYLIYFSFYVFFVILLIGEIPKTVATEKNFPLTYIQIFVLMILTVKLFNNPKKIEKVMLLFSSANLLAIIFTIPDFRYYSNWGQLNRLSGFQGNANEFAVYLSVSVLIFSYWAFQTSRKSYRFLAIIFSIISIIAIILSGSRGAILFLIPVLALQVYRISVNRINYIVIMTILSSIILGIFQSFLPFDYFERILEIPKSITNATDTIGFRYEIWNYGLSLWSKKPVFGLGSGMFYYNSIYSPVLHGIKRVVAHNTYITYLVENGIVGLSLFLVIIIKSIINFERGIRNNINIKNLAITWEAILFIFLLNGIKQGFETGKILWFCVALSIVFIQVQSSTKGDISNSHLNS